MTKYTINLNDVNKLKRFINTIQKYECDLDIIKGRYIIDAKSLMGILTLDLAENVELYVHTDDNEVIKKLKSDIDEVIVYA